MERSTNKNYCSVNLLSEVSKINEKLLTDRLVDHLEKCDLFFISIMAIGLLHQLQIFRQLYLVDLLWLLTGLGLLKLQHLIYPPLTRVWHAGLLHKLMFYVILGQTFGLISSCLSNRQLQVVLDRKSSKKYPVKTRVPQSSTLGPNTFPTLH